MERLGGQHVNSGGVKSNVNNDGGDGERQRYNNGAIGESEGW